MVVCCRGRRALCVGSSVPKRCPRSAQEVILSRIRPSDDRQRRHTVTAIVVAHNGSPWLDELVVGLREQRHQPDRIVAIDTGSEDETPDLLTAAFGHHAMLSAPALTGFGAAVGQVLAAVPPAIDAPAAVPSTYGSAGAVGSGSQHPEDPDNGPNTGPGSEPIEWLWLLHDDCAPDPEALGELLALAHQESSAAVIGPKLRDWPNLRRLLEVGVSIAGSGSRETGLDYNEFDQGQHDEAREVLAVSTAGMLVRRDVYEALGGLDPQLPLFRDDVDFGWRVARAGYEVLVCPSAVVYHAEAGFRRGRALHAVRGRPRRVDRKHAIYTLCVNASAWALPLVFLRLTFGSFVRVLSLLVVKWPDAAFDELAGWAGAAGRLDRVIAARLRNRQHRKVPAGDLRHLRPPIWAGLMRVLDALGSLLSARSGTHVGRRPRRGRAVETGPVAEEAENLVDDDGPNLLRWLAARPLVLLVLGLVVVAAVADRTLFGSGVLSGGALLPSPEGAGALWERYVQAWHPVGLGSDVTAPPYLAVLAAVAVLALGKVWLIVDILLLGAVPLAGLTAAVFVRHLAQSRVVRLWSAVSYALLPATTGAIATGRLGTCVALILLPILGTALLRVCRRQSWPAAFTAGLILAVMTAFVPIVWPAVAGAIVIGVVAYGIGLRFGHLAHIAPSAFVGLVGRLLVPLGVAAAVLLPWTLRLLNHPRLVFTEAGLVDPALVDAALPAWMLALGNPGGLGAAPAWLYAPIVLAALVALVRRDRVWGVATGWLVAGVALVLGVVQTRIDVDVPWQVGAGPAWAGFAAALVLAGLIASTAHGADGIVGRFQRMSISWRQPVAGLLAVVVTVTPVVAVGWWFARAADDPLERRTATVVPEYVVEAHRTGTRPYSLVLARERPNGPNESDTSASMRYSLVRDAGPRLGDAESQSVTSPDLLTALDEPVAQLVTGVGQTAATALASYGVGFVYLPRLDDDELGRQVQQALDATPGLARASAPKGAGMWQVGSEAGRVRIESLDDDGRVVSVRALRAGQIGADVSIPPADSDAGAVSRRVVLAEAADDGWRASLDGRALRAADPAGWGAAAFELPAAGGRLRIDYVDNAHDTWLRVQAIIFGLVVLLAIPTPARRDAPPPPPPPRRRLGASDPAAPSEAAESHAGVPHDGPVPAGSLGAGPVGAGPVEASAP